MGVQLLLPGIPDEITLERICTKLPWRTFKILSLVSLPWQKAIQSRQVYNARVRARSTETLVVHFHSRDRSTETSVVHFHIRDFRITLYSPRDGCCFDLPLIPHLGEVILIDSSCVAFDGKIYLIGGGRPYDIVHVSREVFVLDVAGGREWKQCASMQEPRRGFDCAVSGGKIYVFGGSSPRMGGSEVYDPKVNAWSLIMPMPSVTFGHHVATVGEELFVYGGLFHLPNASGHHRRAASLEAYHPAKDEWRRVVGPCWLKDPDPIFVAKGKIHRMTRFHIDVYDIDKSSLTKRHTNRFRDDERSFDVFSPISALAVDNDLFATFTYGGRNMRTGVNGFLIRLEIFKFGLPF